MSTRSSMLSFAFIAASALGVSGQAVADVNCPTGDCIAYDISTQARCTEVTEAATPDSRWYQGLNVNVDQVVKGGRIAAFQLQWFNGSWSGWYVPGVNDIDSKYNTSNATMRRMWSYFYDHTHRYILCK